MSFILNTFFYDFSLILFEFSNYSSNSSIKLASVCSLSFSKEQLCSSGKSVNGG